MGRENNMIHETKKTRNYLIINIRDILGRETQTKCRPITCNRSKPSSSYTRFV
jgi:hypothetical protein